MTSKDFDRLKDSFIDGGLPAQLVAEMLNEYEENKRRYFLNDYGPAAINGGRFCEAVTRILQFLGDNGNYTPLSDHIKVDQALNKIENFLSLPDGLRLHVVRAIRLVYGIRNNRDNGHLRDDIDPNLQDATLVVSCMDWILSELVRVVHSTTPAEAQSMIANIITREVPLIEEIEGLPVLLKGLAQRDHVLVLLYWGQDGGTGVPRSSLRAWLPENIRRYFVAHLRTLEDERLVHTTKDTIYLTRSGVRHVEESGLLQPL